MKSRLEQFCEIEHFYDGENESILILKSDALVDYFLDLQRQNKDEDKPLYFKNDNNKAAKTLDKTLKIAEEFDESPFSYIAGYPFIINAFEDTLLGLKL